jgi:quinohemoprotein ethanol dehydrogenase
MDDRAVLSTFVKRPFNRRALRPSVALSAAVGGGALLACCFAHAEGAVDGRAIADAQQGANWLSYGRTYSENRYSPLTSINEGNVKDLGLAWYLDLPGQGTLEATPLAVDGTLYFTGTFGKTFAADARTGRKLWEFDPNLGANPQKLRLNMGAHRGVAYWKGRVYVGMNDGRLIALNATDGAVVWSVETTDLSKGNPKLISGAPRVFNGKVVIGHGSAEAGTRGYASAYDADTGRLLWRFDTVPRAPAKGLTNPAEIMAAKTWTGNPNSWGGGSVWDSIVYDPDFNRVYLATGNGNPVNAAVRSPKGGDNLFLCSIVALDADTGRYIWHYQVNPRDSWDYDDTQQLVLADLIIDGHLRKALMQAPKNGFFYVIDRATGKLISAQKYAKVTWATRIDLESGRPVEIPNSHYEKSPVAIWPSGIGAHNWQPMSFDPHEGLVYIPVLNLGMSYGPVGTAGSDVSADHKETDKPSGLYTAQIGAEFDFDSIKPEPEDGTGALLAWDPVAQKQRWRVRYDTFWNGGTLSSAGNLVFQGTGRGLFVAYRASTGEKLWSFDAGLGIIAAPMTYSVDGTQYVSVLVGYGGMAGGGGKIFDYGWRFGEQPRRLLTFSLGSKVRLPASAPPRFTLNAVDDPALAIDPQQAAQGAKVYGANFCSMCHGDDVASIGSIAPDLRETRLPLDWGAFSSMLRSGSLVGAGMPKFDDLSDADMRALYMYIRQRARESMARESR